MNILTLKPSKRLLQILIALGIHSIAFAEWTEAESYTQQSGTKLTNGGTAVGYIQNGDSFTFENFQLPENFDTLEISLAVPQGQLQANDVIGVRVMDATGQSSGTIDFLQATATESWSDFQIQSFELQSILSFVSLTGQRLVDLTFEFQGTGYIVDVDAFCFSLSSETEPPPPAPDAWTEAESYTFETGTQLTNGGTAVGYIQNGDSFTFENFQLPENFDTLEISLAVPQGHVQANDVIGVRVMDASGQSSGTIDFLQASATESWSDFQVQSFELQSILSFVSLTGQRLVDLTFEFQGTGYIVDVDAFRFIDSTAEANTWIEAEDFTSESGSEFSADGNAVIVEGYDWIEFQNIQLPAEWNAIELELAVPESFLSSGNRIIMSIGDESVNLLPVVTGSLETFEIQSFEDEAFGFKAGEIVTVRLDFVSFQTGVSLDAFQFNLLEEPEAAPTEAESFSYESGTQLTQGGTAVGYIEGGDYIGFHNFQMPEAFNAIEITLAVDASAVSEDDRIIVTYGGQEGLKFDYLKPASTGGWNTFETQTFSTSLDIYAGNITDLYFNFEGSGYVADIDSFRFVQIEE